MINFPGAPARIKMRTFMLLKYRYDFVFVNGPNAKLARSTPGRAREDIEKAARLRSGMASHRGDCFRECGPRRRHQACAVLPHPRTTVAVMTQGKREKNGRSHNPSAHLFQVVQSALLSHAPARARTRHHVPRLRTPHDAVRRELSQAHLFNHLHAADVAAILAVLPGFVAALAGAGK